jgi:hypothetical protein
MWEINQKITLTPSVILPLDESKSYIPNTAVLKNKERYTLPTYAARLTCFQHVFACFQGAWHLNHYGLQDVRTGSTIMVCKMCGQVDTVQRCPYWPLTKHSYSTRRPDRMVPYRWPCVTWQSDRTGRTPRRWTHHLLLLAVSALWYRVLSTPEPPVGPWVSM